MLRWLVTLGLSTLSVPALIDYVKAIITAMTGNPDLPDPPINLDDVTLNVNALDAAWLVTQAPSSGPDDTSLVHTKRFLVVSMVNYLAAYVEFTANENITTGESIILSANMGVKDSVGNTGRTFEVRNTPISGQALLRTRSRGIVSYEWAYTIDPAGGGWTAVPSTSIANTIINDLIPGQRYYFRVRANKGTTPGPWQGPVNTIIT